MMAPGRRAASGEPASTARVGSQSRGDTETVAMPSRVH